MAELKHTKTGKRVVVDAKQADHYLKHGWEEVGGGKSDAGNGRTAARSTSKRAAKDEG